MNSAGFRVWVCLSLLLGAGAGRGFAAKGRPAMALPAFLELRGFTNAPGATDPDLLMYWVQGKKQAPPSNLPRMRLPVVMATGSHHYQTYWVPSPRHPGILQTLPLVFLRETGQWIPREAAFLHGPEDPERFVTQWNHHCIVCHSTGGIRAWA